GGSSIPAPFAGAGRPHIRLRVPGRGRFQQLGVPAPVRARADRVRRDLPSADSVLLAVGPLFPRIPAAAGRAWGIPRPGGTPCTAQSAEAGVARARVAGRIGGRALVVPNVSPGSSPEQGEARPIEPDHGLVPVRLGAAGPEPLDDGRAASRG